MLLFFLGLRGPCPQTSVELWGVDWICGVSDQALGWMMVVYGDTDGYMWGQ